MTVILPKEEEKLTKYHLLQDEIHGMCMGYSCIIFPIIIEARIG